MQAELGLLRQHLASCGALPSSSSLDNITPIYIVTPTYARPQQKAELTRLKNAFLLVPSVHWIVVEDAPTKTALVTRLVDHMGQFPQDGENGRNVAFFLIFLELCCEQTD